jgi:TonB family protein
MIVTVFMNGLWQGALVVALVTLVLRLVPRRNATTRYAAWFLALLAVVAVPVATAASHLGAQLLATMQHRGTVATGAFSFVPIGALAHAARSWLDWPRVLGSSTLLAAVGILWIAGGAIGLVRLGVSLASIARIRRRAMELTHIDGVPILTSTELTIPIATGMISPAIVLPRALAQTLNERDLRCTIEHELAHLRRGDVYGNAIQRVAEATLFWNPWIHVVGRRLVAEREAACDDWAVRRIGESAEYASCLAALARRIDAAPAPLLTPSALGSRNALVARIERLMGDHSPDDSSLNYVALGAVTMLFALMTLTLQALLPAPADATSLQPARGGAIVAATACKNPNADPVPIDPAEPDLPKSQFPAHKVSAVVVVTIAPSGKAIAAHVYRSSGDANVDRAVLAAAEKSTYSPKLVNCVPVQGTYLFKAEFAPKS